jgi:hypothetical protein
LGGVHARLPCQALCIMLMRTRQLAPNMGAGEGRAVEIVLAEPLPDVRGLAAGVVANAGEHTATALL